MNPGRPRRYLRAATFVTLALWANAASEARKPAAPRWVLDARERSVAAEGADAVWLHDETEVEPLVEGGLRFTVRRAGRVLRDSGSEALRVHAVGYRDGDTIERLAAWSVLSDGRVLVANKKGVTDVPAAAGYSLYEDSRIRYIKAPAVAVGTVVAFEMVVVRGNDPGAESFVVGDADRPTALSRFSLRVPEGWRWELVRRRLGGAGNPDVEEERGARGVTVTARDLAPLSDERGRPSDRDAMPLVWARWWSEDGQRGYRDWNQVARWFHDLAEPVLDDPGEAATIGRGLAPPSPDAFHEALAAAFDFAARSVRYVSIQIGIGGYRPYTPAEVCKNRFGDCKDKTFLLRALVDPWGVDSRALLVRTSDRGEVEPDVPSPGQFNHCIAAVKLPPADDYDGWNVIEVDGAGRFVLLDATASGLGPRDLPSIDQDTLGLLVGADGGQLVRLPRQPPDSAAVVRKLTASIDDQGRLIEGTLQESWSGTEGAEIRSYYAGKPIEQHRGDVTRDLQSRFPGSSVTGYSIVGLDDPRIPVEETTTISGGRLARRTGPLLIVEPGLVGFGLLDDLGPPPRRLPFHAGLPREETLEVSIAIPSGWKAEALPDPLSVEDEHVSAQADWSLENGRLLYRRTARILDPSVPAERYAEFAERVERVHRTDRAAVVFLPVR